MSNDAPVTPKRKKDKGKKKASAAATADPGGKNEGIDATWAFQPPPGAKLIQNTDIDNGIFDWDTINADEDLELWVLRVPDSVKPKHLEGASLDLHPLPSSSSGPSRNKRKTARIGTLKHRHTTFDIWSLGDADDDDSSANAINNPHSANEGHEIGGGEELKALSCLLPRKSKRGRMYPAPRPIARHIILSAQPPQPTPPQPLPDPTSLTTTSLKSRSRSTNATTTTTTTTRQRYPPELLKHRFMPYGSLVDTSRTGLPNPTTTKVLQGADDGSEDVVMMEVDNNLPLSPLPPPPPLSGLTQPNYETTATVTAKPTKSSKKKKHSGAGGEGESASLDLVEQSEGGRKAEKAEKKNKKRKGEEDLEQVVSSKKPKKARKAAG